MPEKLMLLTMMKRSRNWWINIERLKRDEVKRNRKRSCTLLRGKSTVA
jgi:hypothetical protein